MSDSEPLSPAVAAVVARWNPQGDALLRAVPPAGGAGGVPVTVIGPDDATTAQLRWELGRFEPRVELAEPGPDPAAPPAVALILLDAGAALGAATLDLAARLHAAGSPMIFALNGFHAHAEWRAIHERDRTLLGRALGAEPEVLPVSARMAATARDRGDAALLDRSGVGALHARLTAAVGAPAGSNGVVVERVLADTRRRILDQAEALRSGELARQVREERATLLAGRDGGRAQALGALRNRANLARLDLVHEASARVRTLNTAARADLERLRRRDAAAFQDRLQQAVHELTAELDAMLTRRLAEITRQLEALTGPVTAPVPRTDPPPRLRPDFAPRRRGVEDRLMVAVGASAGFGIGRLVVAPLSLVPALDYATWPIALALGAGVAYWVVRARGHVADRAHLREWIAEALGNVKSELERRMSTALMEAESELTDQVVRASTARVVATDQRIAELEAQLRQLHSNRPAQLAACERDLAVLDAR
ncbi:hypothetical protein ACFYTQ_07950 [Nocardia sp. NPDC004068]|uniref:hypothetical protein n=1 Tax=Nocardia sp. NPDC004068 TaxID=3364303 RepID=UPI00369F24D4